jgi:hypothetical protein
MHVTPKFSSSTALAPSACSAAITSEIFRPLVAFTQFVGRFLPSPSHSASGLVALLSSAFGRFPPFAGFARAMTLEMQSLRVSAEIISSKEVGS